MMRVIILLLTLDVLGVSSVMMEKRLKQKLEGKWRTIYLAASTEDKIKEGSPLRTYFRLILCGRNCNQIYLYFFIKKGAKCQEYKVTGRKEQEVYFAEYEGNNALVLKTVNEKILLFHYFNTNKKNEVTRVAGVLGKGKQLTKEEMTEYMNLVESIGIEDEKVLRVMDTDNCPSKIKIK
ncbi:probasin-like [Arvicanthis niloticus]|uniref:probasin-like n=1 Tax=Arvicanthis niloticus TaxID=61156 RepID=UPI001486EE49|nr:probasin-like [Arvicanthis niloticus]